MCSRWKVCGSYSASPCVMMFSCVSLWKLLGAPEGYPREVLCYFVVLISSKRFWALSFCHSHHASPPCTSPVSGLRAPPYSRCAPCLHLLICLPPFLAMRLRSQVRQSSALPVSVFSTSQMFEPNWPGRLAVAPVMGSFFFAMAGLPGLGEVLLYIGLALALVASGIYVASGVRQLRAEGES